MYAVILSSGFATRLRPLTESQSKAMLLVGGRPILSHVVDMIPSGIPVIVTTNKVFELDFTVWARGKERVELEVEEIYQIGDCPGPIGSLRNLIDRRGLKGPLLVLACDNYFDRNLSDFISGFDGETTLVATCHVDTYGEASWHGIPEVDKDGQIINFWEKPTPVPDILISPLCYIFPGKILPLISNEPIMWRAPYGKMPRAGDFISYLVESGLPVRAYYFEERWKHLTTIKSYYKLVKEIKNGV